jgi:Gluconate 2-dehydrogenase subunit 3
VLKPDEVETLEAIGETLLPGARKAGIANFVDHQLGVPPGDCLLMARVASVMPPFANFYHGALAAIERSSQALHMKRFAQLTADEQYDFVDRMRQNKIDGWQGPPGPFVYFLMRHDAVDVTYGTVEGIESLGIPYMPHIAPEKKW